jgi:hypothetical protein
MIDGLKRVEFANVEVISKTGLVLLCRIGSRIVGVPPLLMLPGSEIRLPGDRGRLVLPLDLAKNLGLVLP